MSIQAFFNQPDKAIDLSLLWKDMEQTKNHLVLASAWFTDIDTADVFIRSPARRKTALFNAADTNRGDTKALTALRTYNNKTAEAVNAEFRQATADKRHPDYSQFTDIHIYILGSGNWQEGVMHHKFILCDAIVWVGSFNFTFQARKNYENLVRIQSRKIAKQFYNEIDRLDPYAVFEHGPSSTFLCRECNKVLTWNLHGQSLGYGDELCRDCATRGGW